MIPQIGPRLDSHESGRFSPQKLVYGCGFAALAAIAGMGVFLYFSLGQYYWIFKNRALGTLHMPEAQAREVMGAPPKFVLEPRDLKGRSPNDVWKGMNFEPIPTFPVHRRVLLYQSAWSAAYLFIGNDGRVEHVDVAGT